MSQRYKFVLDYNTYIDRFCDFQPVVGASYDAKDTKFSVSAVIYYVLSTLIIYLHPSGAPNRRDIMKRIFLSFAIVITAMTLVVGCCDCSKRSKLEKPLVGTEWQIVQLMGKDITAVEDSYTILFHDNGTATGVGDCNRITATYSISQKRDMKISNLGSTRRLCPNFEQENLYYEVLESVTHYEMDAENMLLLSNGTLVAIMHPRAL